MAAVSPRGVVPALCVSRQRDFVALVKTVGNETSWLHVDVVDDTLFSGRTISLSTLPAMPPTTRIQVHVMVRNPLKLVPAVRRQRRIRSIVLHQESDALGKAIGTYRALGLSVWLTAAPATPWRIGPSWNLAGIQIMGVKPGASGHPWLASTLTRLKNIQRAYPGLPLQVDGGVTKRTLPALARRNVQSVAVGSAISTHPHPVTALRELRTTWRALRKKR